LGGCDSDKIIVIDDMFLQDATIAIEEWRRHLNLHGTLDKGRVLYLKNFLYSINMEEGNSILEHML
jgi:hypothetical protein